MKAFAHPDQALHQPIWFVMRGRLRPNFEVAARAESLLAGLRQAGIAPSLPPPAPMAAIEAVHDPAYLAFLRDAAAEWAALADPGPELVPNIHPTPEMLEQGGGAGPHVIGRLGQFTADTGCPIGPGTWQASLGAAACAFAAAEVAAAGGHAYALCRPPGHHAYGARAGGHCYLNNAAIAVAHLRARGARRVAVLDIDSHHGNGTQGIFWRDPSVLTVSVHGDPDRYYPWYIGRAQEVGGPGAEGSNLNLPLAFGTADSGWLAAIATGIAAIRAFGAEALVVPLGFDASEHEPLNALSVTPDGFARAGAAIRAIGLPTAITQEGGYNVALIGSLLARFLDGFGG
jgi:acetoin utilization deacetylase AcuC-like enzyme